MQTPIAQACVRLQLRLWLALPLACVLLRSAIGAESVPRASIDLFPANRLEHKIPKFITGKFCEHLGANIYNGMDAQILRNPTFADVPFFTGQMTPDGITTFHFEDQKIESELRRQALRSGWPEAELAQVLAARSSGMAAFWARLNDAEASPDTGPNGSRAQRLRLKPETGFKQWTWLPLHRTNVFEFEILARSPDLKSVMIKLGPEGEVTTAATASVELTHEWKTIKGQLSLHGTLSNETRCRLEVLSPGPGQLVVAHLFLWPADHIHGADPDVIRFLKDSHLPLLRWPGGNFVSAYHWRDGVGPVEQRPTRPNYAWGGIEPNTFGTAEFISFCRAVGCEPMICVNAGTGTPEEAAFWIEYCNGPATSPGGALRAAHGYPEPFAVKHWEVGNELWGKWQAHWTTAEGYVDRYHRFADAMLKADPTISLYACGAPVLWGKAWNDTLIKGTAARLRSITDHPLIGGNVDLSADPMDVFRDFMYVPSILQIKWSDLENQMRQAGIVSPRLAVTELQMFAHLGSTATPGAVARLTRQNLVNPATMAEALYDTLIYHTTARLQPFVELVTHSATVNHGGGLRKERERVYPNPCHYANQLFASFAGATPIEIRVQTGTQQAPVVLPEIKSAATDRSFPSLDAFAALTASNDILVSIVNRAAVAQQLSITPKRFSASAAFLQTLAAPHPWSVNSLENRELVLPQRSTKEMKANSLEFEIPAFAAVQVLLSASDKR